MSETQPLTPEQIAKLSSDYSSTVKKRGDELSEAVEARRRAQEANIKPQEQKPVEQGQTTVVKEGQSAAQGENASRVDGVDLRRPEDVVIGKRTDYKPIV